MKLATVSPMRLSSRTTDTFYGLYRSLRPAEGFFAMTENLSGRAFPMLATRERRSLAATLDTPRALLGKARLAWIDGSALYYAGQDVTGYLTAAGVSIGSALPKKLVSMGSYLLIFPDKLYFNTADFTDCGAMEAHFTTTGTVSFTPSDSDGSVLENVRVSSSAPEEPVNGALWIDTGSVPHALRQYSASDGIWAEKPTSYTRIGAANIGLCFSRGDGVSISGCVSQGTAAEEQIAALNGVKQLSAVGTDYITVPGLIDCLCTQDTPVTVSRSVPNMDHIVQAQNRLWGCRFGMSGGKAVNELCACALGDFKNWDVFAGLAGDSYRASVGSDGPWTGAAVYMGNPVFFKENVMHKVYVSASGAHSVIESACQGVEQGSAGSIAAVNGALYYKSAKGVYRYDGALPSPVGAALGDERLSSAVAGAFGDRYFLCARDADGASQLFVYDTRRGTWYREDGLDVLAFAGMPGELYALCADGGLWALGGSDGETEGAFPWRAETGMLTYAVPGGKLLRRIRLRLRLAEGAEAEIFTQYDSSGVWKSAAYMSGSGAGTLEAVIKPVRCDHFRLAIAGTGEAELIALTADTCPAEG